MNQNRYNQQPVMMMNMPFNRGPQPFGMNSDAPRRKGMLGRNIKPYMVGEQRWDREDSDGERIQMNDDDEIVLVAVDKDTKKGLNKMMVANEAAASFFLSIGLDKDEVLSRLQELESHLWFNGPRRVFDAQIAAMKNALPDKQRGRTFLVENTLMDRKNARMKKNRDRLVEKVNRLDSEGRGRNLAHESEEDLGGTRQDVHMDHENTGRRCRDEYLDPAAVGMRVQDEHSANGYVAKVIKDADGIKFQINPEFGEGGWEVNLDTLRLQSKAFYPDDLIKSKLQVYETQRHSIATPQRSKRIIRLKRSGARASGSDQNLGAETVDDDL